MGRRTSPVLAEELDFDAPQGEKPPPSRPADGDGAGQGPS